MMAERCWSYSREIKAEIQEDEDARHAPRVFPSGEPSRKGMQMGEDALHAVQRHRDARPELEAEVQLDGRHLALEKEQWGAALASFDTAKQIYDQLGKVGTLEQQALIKERVQEIVPTMRFCQFNSAQCAESMLRRLSVR